MVVSIWGLISCNGVTKIERCNIRANDLFNKLLNDIEPLNDSTFKILKSNIKHFHRYNIVGFVVDSIDDNKNQDFISIIFNKMDTDVSLGSTQFLDIGIKSDNYLIAGNCVINPDNIRSIIKNHYQIYDNFQKPICYEEKLIPFLGVKKIPEIGYHITVDINSNKGLNQKDWDLYFKVLREIKGFYIDKRNELATVFFNKEYSSLSFEEKKAIIEYRPIRIVLSFGIVSDVIVPLPKHAYPQEQGW
ncbi:MAG: hypothetical protein JXA77_03755 [Bacteroidales bacterium]|nr:hypothetical protein [Bacteroidales bacterium]